MLVATARQTLVRTRHRRGPQGLGPGELLPSPVAARIEPRDRGCALVYLGSAGTVLVQSHHGSVESAKAQARVDLGILDDDWRETPPSR
jgi:hypothetical protein